LTFLRNSPYFTLERIYLTAVPLQGDWSVAETIKAKIGFVSAGSPSGWIRKCQSLVNWILAEEMRKAR
jgi:hypothetical protein